MTSTNQLVIKWAEDKGITKFKPQGQLTKVLEEFGEFSATYIRWMDGEDTPELKKEMIDAIGDTQVTLIILSAMTQIDYDFVLSESKIIDNLTRDYELVANGTVFLADIATAVNKSWHEELVYAYIRMLSIVRTLAWKVNVDFDRSLEVAYAVIAGRTGEMRDGVFVKSEDIK